MNRNSRVQRLTAMIVASAVVGFGLAVGIGAPASAADGRAPIEQRNESTVTADPLPTVQIDAGIVWTQVINGDTVYAGGSFSNARPAGAAPGANLMPRSNLLAYDITTGVATSFAPQINGTVRSLAVSPDGSRLYVGGSFNNVNGQTRFNFAAFDTATGNLLTTFKPAIGGSYVNAIVATDTTVYVGGLIGAAGGVTRKNLAAVSTAGAVLGWAPTTDLQVDTMVMDPTQEKVIIGGRFSLVNGASQRGLAALDVNNGSVLPWAVTATVRNGWGEGGNTGKAGISTLTTDGDAVFGTGWVFANKEVGNLEGLFAAEAGTGNVRWIADCHGDHYGVYSDGTNVYSTGHEHDCQTAGGLPQANPAPGNLRHATIYTAARKGTLTTSPYVNSIYADWGGYPAPAAVNWYPDWTTGTVSGSGQAGWTVTGNGEYVVVGGEFPYVNGQRNQGIARFSNDPAGGPKQAPRLAGAAWQPTAKSVQAETVRVSIPANWDRDDLNITYELRRDGVATPVATKTVSSTFWKMPTVTLTDTGLQPGSSQTYRVIARDGDGNSATSNPVVATVSSTPASAYATAVLDTGANQYWRLGSRDGAADWAGTNDGVVRSGASWSSSNAIAGDSGGGAVSLNGSSTGLVSSTSSMASPREYSVELWFNTTTSSGGKLVGFGSSASGNSSNYDRHLYMRNDGRIIFGSYSGVTNTVTSPAAYRDGAWHHAVATQGANGIELYVDGTRVASNAAAPAANDYVGYWRVGGDNLGGWPNQPSSSYFNGRVDEVAVYPTALSSDQISAHYAIGAGLARPTAVAAATGAELSWQLSGAGSTAPAGRTISSYTWDFGDGKVATGVTASHTYEAPGTYTVTLTVRDSANMTATATTSVVATPPHVPPTAAITSTPTGLSVAFDASASTTSGSATLSGYAWDFGDGSTSNEAAVTHAYAAAGTYTVSLSVTDSTGAVSEPVTAEVAVSHAAPEGAFTSSTSGLMASFDASGSMAHDGATLEYNWDFGDGTAGTGVAPTHTYETNGTFDVTLTVSDSLGATGDVIVKSVTVASVNFVARDDFERTSATGWGTAPVGGTWSGAAGFGVSDGAGRITLSASQTRSAFLDGALAADVDATVQVATDKVANGGGIHFNLVAHKSAAGDYRAKLRISASGVVTVSLARLVGTAETQLVSKVLSGYTHVAGAPLNVRLETVTTSGTTALKVKVWAVGSEEPADWFITASDATAALQTAGQVGVLSYLSGSTSNAPVAVSVDNLSVIGAAVAPPHAAPVASFTADAADLSVAFDSSASTASDGASIAGYSWDLGDGNVSTEAHPTHDYGAAGVYPVSLTVTDSEGAVSQPVVQNVTVTAPPAPDDPIAQDDFARDVAGGLGTAPIGGAWTGTAGLSATGGGARFDMSAGQTRWAALSGVNVLDSDMRMVVSTDKVANGGGAHINLTSRKTAAGEYRLKLRVAASGSVTVSIAKVVAGTETTIASRALGGYTHTAGAALNVRLQLTTADGTTELKGAAWPVGTEQPAAWTVTAADAQSELQQPGQVGMLTYLSGSATNAPLAVVFDDLLVK
ncbi:PKD domain-containing protein [Microbacterium sp. GXF0217]